MFDHEASLGVKRNAAGGLIRVAVFIQDDNSFSWDRALWNRVTGVLQDGYGAPLLSRADLPRSYGGTTYCSAFETTGEADVRVEWSSLFAVMSFNCQVTVFYDGPGWPEHVHARSLAEARVADRTCRADLARAQRDRNRLAPGSPASPLPLPPRTAPRIQVRAGAASQPANSTTDLVEVEPSLIGGMRALEAGIEYPEFERRGQIEGRVIVQFVVSTQGIPSNVTIARSVSPGLDRAAVQAVQHARFTPGTQNGQPVRVQMTLPVTFRIVDPVPPVQP